MLNLGRIGEGAPRLIEELTALADHLDLDDQREGAADPSRVDDGDIGEDHAICLHAFDTALHGGGRKADRVGDRTLRKLVVLLKQIENGAVYPIQRLDASVHDDAPRRNKIALRWGK